MGAMVFQKYKVNTTCFLVCDSQKLATIPDAAGICALCDPTYGFGADGVLIGPIYTQDSPGVCMYDAQGNELLHSGPGVAVFAKYLQDAGYLEGSLVKIETVEGVVQVQALNSAYSTLHLYTNRFSFGHRPYCEDTLGVITWIGTMVPSPGFLDAIKNADDAQVTGTVTHIA